MRKKPRVRTLIDSQHDKGTETLIEIGQHYFSQIFLTLWKKVSSKNSFLEVSEILRRFVSKLRPDDKYSLSVKARLFNATSSNAIISKSKNICWIFFCVSRIYMKLLILWKKRWASVAISFLNQRQQKARLLKCLKSPLSEHLWTVNMLKGPKDYLKLHGSFFVIIFDNSEIKSDSKIPLW